MDVKKYIERKKDGFAEVVKAGGGYALAFRKWNIDTGKSEEPDIQAVDVDTLAKQKEDLKSQIADIDALLADIKELG